MEKPNTDKLNQLITSADFTYLSTESIEEEWICTICKFPFYEPVCHSTCGNLFCENCVESLKSCPLCDCPPQDEDFKRNLSPPPKSIKNHLDKLKVICKMCKNPVNRGDLKNHE